MVQLPATRLLMTSNVSFEAVYILFAPQNITRMHASNVPRA